MKRFIIKASISKMVLLEGEDKSVGVSFLSSRQQERSFSDYG